jgi:hypothetical protein
MVAGGPGTGLGAGGGVKSPVVTDWAKVIFVFSRASCARLSHDACAALVVWPKTPVIHKVIRNTNKTGFRTAVSLQEIEKIAWF